MSEDVLAALVDQLSMTFSPFSSKMITWRCTENASHTWEATFAQREALGCPMCEQKKS